MADLKAKSSELLEDLFRQNGIDIETSLNIDAFNINRLITVGSGIMEAVDFLDDNLRAYFDPGSVELEDKREKEKEREFQLRGIVGNNLQARLRQIDDEIDDRMDRVSDAAREKQEMIRRERLEQEQEARAAAARRERDNDERKSPITTNVKPRAHFKAAHGDYETVGSTVNHALENPRDVAGDIVESVAGKDVRQFGGKVLRGELGAAVEQVAGKDTRETLREVKHGITTSISGTFNAAADTAVAAKDAVVDTAVAAKNSVVNTVSGWLPSWGK
ncbi:MAG: hypothetical protein DI586_07610 [Micavibrio aeruginosavorus]|uniref:Uncharacterized protein n=1 Tax=Micavibrio aeruginosavorus TaxID=349221 RepID=A0A2W5FMY3_9BACT|nr:MAG: hypothetical protein DI586_07610 [Micavibrio aeruginosavorus]